MPEITRQDFIAGVHATRTIQSITWRRRVDKFVKRCVTCDAETACHRGQRFCNACDEFVATYNAKEANKGDVVKMQLIPRINPLGTKNWTPSGGFIFNARTREAAEAIKRDKGLMQVLKMGEQVPDETLDADATAMIASGDLRAVPRCFGLNDVVTWTAEGTTWDVVDR